MDSYCVLVLIIIPSVTAVIDCRSACRSCRDKADAPEILQVNCDMCQECKQKRREKLQARAAHNAVAPFAVATASAPPVSPFPDRLAHEHYTDGNTPVTFEPDMEAPEGCPTQPPCSDSEESTPPVVQNLALIPTTTTSTTTTTTTTTTRRPCPAIRPCGKKPAPLKLTSTLPPASMPWPPPVPMPPPMPPPIPPAMAGCYCMPGVCPCPSYPYMPYMPGPYAPPYPLAPSVIAQAYNSHQESYKNQGSHTGPSKNNLGYYGNHRGIAEVLQGSGKSMHQDNSMSRNERYSVREDSNEEIGVHNDPIVVMTEQPQLHMKKKDFVYMFVGVPKNVLKS